MDYSTFYLIFSFLLAFIYVITIANGRNSRLPPGPYPIPIIGNLLQLGDKPHLSLATLSKHYGPLMSLKLGRKITIVVSSPDIARQFFQTHDHSFSNRSVPDSIRVVDHNKYSVAWLPAEDKWRSLRRISKEYLFSVQHLDASELLRKKKVQELLDHVHHCCTSEKTVSIGEVVFTTTLNILSNFMFSMDFAQYDSTTSQEFKGAVWGLMEVGGKPNLADFFPILKPFDPQGLVRRGNVYGKKILNSIDRIIDQRLQERSSLSTFDDVTSTNNDILDSLLNLIQKDESEFSKNDMRHLFFILFMAGIDTTANIVEWAMAELICNPEKMKIVRSEMIELMEKNNNNNNIQERDISHLSYLQAVIKETLRLHPPFPFLLPHKAINDVEIEGFMVPKDAEILCNVWAIGHDPKVWSRPETFIPERFLEVKIDYKGQDFNLIPFGAGRRICPGINMVYRMLPTILGSLIHKFNWKLEGDMRAQDLDMSEKFGLTVQKNIPLKVIPIKL